MKKWAPVVLAAVMGLSLLAGCNNPAATPTKTTPPPTTPGATSVAPGTQSGTVSPQPTPTPGAPRPAPKGTLNLFGADPLTLDPALAGDANSGSYIIQIFTGLVRLDNNMQPVGDIAQSWDISTDGKTYTFHLRPEAKFQDGRGVKASDFKFSFERAANPATNSSTAMTYLGDIVGVKEMLAGKATSISGIKVVDDATLQITIDTPKVYFLSKMTFTAAFVVDRNNVSKGATWWTSPNGTGPFKLTQYTKQKQLTLTRSDVFYGDKALVNSVVFQMLSGVPMDLYETGKIDVVGVSTATIERASDPAGPFAGQLAQAPELSYSYIGFNSTKPPLDDPNIRLALSYALDKDKLVSVMFKNMVQRADGILPPGLPGYNKDLKGIPFDVNKAKQLITQSKYGSVANLPPITITTEGEGGGVSSVLEAVAFQWKQNLGLDVTIRAIEPERYIFHLQEEVDNMYDFGWIADYPHPQNFLDVLLHTGATNNYGGYSNPSVDGLLDKAGTTQDSTASLALYQQAEQKLIDDGATLPLFFTRNYIMVKPYVHGYKLTPLGFVMLNNVSVDSH